MKNNTKSYQIIKFYLFLFLFIYLFNFIFLFLNRLIQFHSHQMERIVSGSSDKSIIIWDAESGNQLKTFNGHSDWVIFLNIFFNLN